MNHDENNFIVSFNTRDYALIGHILYYYRLKGLSNNWYPVESGNSITFHDLPYGDYILQIKAVLKNDNQRYQSSEILISVNPPIWLSWYAKFIYFLIAISIAYYSLRLYKRKLELTNSYKMEKQDREKEQELNKERLRFYTNITHELRTPLTLILGPLEDMQQDGNLDEQQKKKVNIILKSANRLLDLINRILEFRKAETQNRKLSVSRTNLSQTIHEIGFKYQELNKNKDLEINIYTEPDNLTMYFDKEIISIILDNLISNALKYTPTGSITIKHKVTREKDTDYVDISVADTGYGIANDALPHIFERYYQESSNHQVSGSGIGLALVKSLAILHEGEISVKSEINKGSKFTLRLLLDNIYPDAIHKDSEPIEIRDTAIKETIDKPILLVVEDNDDICDYIKTSFEDNFLVITAHDGKEGLDKAFEKIPDIVISDIMMPLMDGMELCHRLKDDMRTCHIPIILLTAKDSLYDKEEGYSVGADSYLTKPFSTSLLISRVNNLIESRKMLYEHAFSTQKNEKKFQINQSLNKLDNEFIQKVTNIIEKDLSSNKMDIDYISQMMCMSSSSLYRKMKALTGISTNEFVRKVKMRNAEKLLLERSHPVSEIAYMLGFSTPSYFRQCFKEEYGESPSEYIKKIMKA